MIMIPTSAVRIFVLLSHTTLLSNIMGTRNYREISAIVKLTKHALFSLPVSRWKHFWGRMNGITVRWVRLGGHGELPASLGRSPFSPLCRFLSPFLPLIDHNSCNKTPFT